MNGLGPQDRRIARESIVSQFFDSVAMKQVNELDELLSNNSIGSLMYKGHVYANSKFSKNNVCNNMGEEATGELREEFENFLYTYEGLEMEMASMSALLTRLFRKCNSLYDMIAVMPKCIVPFFIYGEMDCTYKDDYDTVYLTKPNIDTLSKENEVSINLVKARLMMDEVFR